MKIKTQVYQKFQDTGKVFLRAMSLAMNDYT